MRKALRHTSTIMYTQSQNETKNDRLAKTINTLLCDAVCACSVRGCVCVCLCLSSSFCCCVCNFECVLCLDI